jgi:hypothetical protein
MSQPEGLERHLGPGVALFWVRIVRISSLVGSSRRSQTGRP